MEALRHFAAGQVMKRVIAPLFAREKSLHAVIYGELAPSRRSRERLCRNIQNSAGVILHGSEESRIFCHLQPRDPSAIVFEPETPNPRLETYSASFCVHQGTMEAIRQVAPALWRQDSKNSWIFGSSSSYSICVPPSLTLTSIGLSSPSATKL